MADETVPVHRPDSIEAELAKSRESASRLMDNLARKIGAHRAVHSTAVTMRRAAQFVQGNGVKDMAAGVDRAVRQYPAASILVAVAAGFLVGRALRPR